MLYIQNWFKKRVAQGSLESKSREFSDLFPESASIEQVATGFQFTEGPVWIAEQQCLLFSDIPANKIFRLNLEGCVTVFREPSDHANGLTRDRQGRLIVCEHGNRRLTRTEIDGQITILSDRFAAKKLNSPNDVVVKSDGAIYFTDPPYGICSEQQEQAFQGVYRLSPDGNDLTVVADDFIKPNGLTFSPDEQTLYIADSSERCHIRAFDVETDGTLTNSRVFQDMRTFGQSGDPDGLKVDRAGHLYATGPGGIWVLNSDGVHLGTIVLPEQPANCAWGDSNWQSLYVTARTSVYKIRVNLPGVPLLSHL